MSIERERPVLHGSGRGWQEAYLGGSAAGETRLFAHFEQEINEIQRTLAARQGSSAIRRAFHAKAVAAFAGGQLVVPAGIPTELAVGVFRRPGTKVSTVRFSNASGLLRADQEGDLRGIAIRVLSDESEESQDLLLTNAPASHARDAEQFMIVAKALAQRSRLTTVYRLLRALGPGETWRILKTLRSDARRVESLASESFWSRSAFAFGDVAVRLKLTPESVHEARSPRPDDLVDDYLRRDLAERLKETAITYSLQVQRYIDESTTSIEDSSAVWSESASPLEPIARLVIPQQALPEAASRDEAAIDDLEFSPWNTNPEIRPLGSLNRARRAVYPAGAALRRGSPQR